MGLITHVVLRITYCYEIPNEATHENVRFLEFGTTGEEDPALLLNKQPKFRFRHFFHSIAIRERGFFPSTMKLLCRPIDIVSVREPG